MVHARTGTKEEFGEKFGDRGWFYIPYLYDGLEEIAVCVGKVKNNKTGSSDGLVGELRMVGLA